ncbi:MAG: chloride channel protein, partial [Gemmatimonadota bacterium]|nr:chloride channel protein [Gemmatimonadota bacterium]
MPEPATDAPKSSFPATARKLLRRWVVVGRIVWDEFVKWFNAREFSENSVLLGFAVAIGILAALGVVAFYKAIDAAYAVFFAWPARYIPPVTVNAYRPVITGLGFAAAYWIMHRFGQGNDGMNVPDVQLAVIKRGGYIPSRPALARTAASAVTIGSGGSAGAEGPVVVLGAFMASWLGRRFRFEPGRLRVLVGCATGAAISAAFNAPLAGAFFALEETLGTLSGISFAPVVVASVMSAVVTRAVFGNHPAFQLPSPDQFTYSHVSEVLVFFPLLGVISGLVAAGFVRVYFGIGDRVKTLKHSPMTIAAAGGALVGLLVFVAQGHLVGYGHLAINVQSFTTFTWYALAALAVGKILVTALTLNTGGSGGVFTPSLYIGAATGGALGSALAAAWPSGGINPGVYGLVGMGAMIAGATDAPITGILLAFEMTNDYSIVLPLMLTVVIAHTIARRLEPDSLYSGWLRRRGESLVHGADRDTLAGLRVADAYDRDASVLEENAPVHDFIMHTAHRDQGYFPVVDAERRLIGVVALGDLSEVTANSGNLADLIVAADVARPTETVTLDDSLLEAIRKMGVRGAAAVPVVDRPSGRYLGLITRSHVLSLY